MLGGALLTIRGLSLLILVTFAASAQTRPSDLGPQFVQTVRPFLEKHCVACHSGQTPAAQFDLSVYKELEEVVRDHQHWSLLAEKLRAKQMPPAAAPQPPDEARAQVVSWVEAMLDHEARRNAGDPGTVLARRLSNAEYNYTIRDLTGVDIRPTREFPVDPANPAGFDNSGESLAMSPALLGKYLQAAHDVANHMVLTPTGVEFAPYSMLVETDQDKYCVTRIVDFYHAQNTNYADYFLTAWRYKHRSKLGAPEATLASLAKQDGVSAKYLATIWKALEEEPEEIGPLAKLHALWAALPAPASGQRDLAREGADAMRDYVVGLRKKLEPRFEPLKIDGISSTSQPFLIWKNRQYAMHRRTFDRMALEVEGEPTPDLPDPSQLDGEQQKIAEHYRDRRGDPELQVPAGQRAPYEAAFERFSSIFPDAFYISERGRYYLDPTRDKGRFLSAGFHNLMGYFRDDQPLYELVLDEEGQRRLDALWRELDYVALATNRTFVQFYLSESGEARGGGRESEGERPETSAITSEEVIRKVEAAYLERARPSGNETALEAIRDRFESVNETIRWVEQAKAAAEPLHRDALLALAENAYRRPLSERERNELLEFYRTLRDRDGLSHEDAMRDSLVRVLMSPSFCYRVDLVEAAGEPEAAEAKTISRLPISDYSLASRLSYFLWSSMPDAELLSHAAAGDLHKPEVIAAQARRMLRDPRSRGLATELGGNWLDFRRFEQHNAVDRERFPSFDDDLREAMFREPIEFLADLIRNDRPLLDLLYADRTFVNSVLAKHYGMTDVKAGPEEWVRVDNAGRYGRGGLLPMAVFLTMNAPGLRTSPVKRGYWVVRRVLGEQIPPPPAVVPELPRDESKMDLLLRDALARHREDPMCASCHARFDSFGLAFEGYGPIGERRTEDLAGRPVDARATFPGAEQESEGFEGVRGTSATIARTISSTTSAARCWSTPSGAC